MILGKQDYLNELNDIRNKLTDFLQKINSGKSTYFKDLALKLRIIYCDKSGTKALIKTIEAEYDLKVNVVVKHSIAEHVRNGSLPESLSDGLIMDQLNSVVTWFQSGDQLLPIIDAINKQDEIFIQDRYYSYKEIFEAMADKMGGAHVDSSISDDILIPHSDKILIGGLSVAQRAIYDTAKATITLINLINAYISEPFENDVIKPATPQPTS